MPASTLDPAVLLVNRRARRARDDGWLRAVRATLGERFSLDVRVPGSADETAEFARAASRDEGALVIVAGGDGTVSAAAHGLAGTGGRLGILPLGAANDLARELGVPRDPREAADRIRRGAPHQTDLVLVNGRHFATVGGLGLVSRSTIVAARLRTGGARHAARLLGRAVYKLAAAGSLLERRITRRVRVAWRDPDDGAEHRHELDVHGIFVTNHTTCGGGLVIPTRGRADDGIFELALIPATSRARLLVNLQRLAAGRPLAPGVLAVLRARCAVIETDEDDVFAADGDLLAAGRRFTLEARRGAIGIVR